MTGWFPHKRSVCRFNELPFSVLNHATMIRTGEKRPKMCAMCAVPECKSETVVFQHFYLDENSSAE